MNRNPYEGTLEVLNKDDRSFRIRKTTPKMALELEFSFRGDQVKLTKNGVEIPFCETNLDRLFYVPMHGTPSGSEIIGMISTEATEPLFRYAFSSLSCSGYERIRKVSRALMRIRDKPEIQTLAFCGFTDLAAINKLRLSRLETVPNKILNVPKYLVPVIKGMGHVRQNQIIQLRELDSTIQSTNLKTMIEIAKEESNLVTLLSMTDLIIELYGTYGYKDIKRLSLYLMREAKLEQGISQPVTAATLLRDYARMSKAMGTSLDKYTKSLKKDHDITVMNYSVNASEYKNREFKLATEGVNYLKLQHKRRDYTILVPDTVQSVIKEGSSLSHCVASYVDDIIGGKCKILYLRNTCEVEEPLVTIEVRDNNIRQVRGKCNRRATEEEMSFVKRWADKHELALAVH